jgi:hypothetical protein
MTRKFVPDTLFSMFASRVDNQPVAEYKAAPYGKARRWGLFTDSNEEWDPEVSWIRVQDKGLPILYHRDAVYNLTVA